MTKTREEYRIKKYGEKYRIETKTNNGWEAIWLVDNKGKLLRELEYFTLY